MKHSPELSLAPPTTSAQRVLALKHPPGGTCMTIRTPEGSEVYYVRSVTIAPGQSMHLTNMRLDKTSYSEEQTVQEILAGLKEVQTAPVHSINHSSNGEYFDVLTKDGWHYYVENAQPIVAEKSRFTKTRELLRQLVDVWMESANTNEAV